MAAPWLQIKHCNNFPYFHHQLYSYIYIFLDKHSSVYSKFFKLVQRAIHLLALRLFSECVKPYRRIYGENFEHNVPENGSLLEFSPRGAPPEAMPVVLWNQKNPETNDGGRGRLLRGGKVWVAERVTQADQGNYTMRDDSGKVLSRSTLSVRGEQSTKVYKRLI